MKTAKRRLRVGNLNDRNIDHLLQATAIYEPLSRKEEQDLARKCEAGDREAMDKLVLHNLKFGASMIKKYATSEAEFCDLMNEAVIAMYAAARNFKPRNIKYISYAMWYIRTGLQRFSHGPGRLVAVPAQVGQAVGKIKTLRSLNKSPEVMEPTEMRSTLGISENTTSITDNALNVAKTLRPTVSLNRAPANKEIDSNSTQTYQDLLKSESPLPDSCLDRLSREKAVSEAMSCLPPRSQSLLRLMFFNDPQMSLTDAGKEWGISRERVRQINRESFDRMRLLHGDRLASALGIDWATRQRGS